MAKNKVAPFSGQGVEVDDVAFVLAHSCCLLSSSLVMT